MKPNAFAVFRVENDGTILNRNFSPHLLQVRSGLEIVSKPTFYKTQEEAKDSINIPADLLSDVVYVVLPVYTNKEIK